MFKSASLFIKVVCVNNTYNLNLIPGAYIFFIYEILRSKTAKFWLSWGGQTRTERFHIFHVFFWSHSPFLNKCAIKNIIFWNTLKRLAKCIALINCLSSRLCHVSHLICFYQSQLSFAQYIELTTINKLDMNQLLFKFKLWNNGIHCVPCYVLWHLQTSKKCTWIIQDVRFCDKLCWGVLLEKILWQ